MVCSETVSKKHQSDKSYKDQKTVCFAKGTEKKASKDSANETEDVHNKNRRCGYTFTY